MDLIDGHLLLGAICDLPVFEEHNFHVDWPNQGKIINAVSAEGMGMRITISGSADDAKVHQYIITDGLCEPAREIAITAPEDYHHVLNVMKAIQAAGDGDVMVGGA